MTVPVEGNDNRHLMCGENYPQYYTSLKMDQRINVQLCLTNVRKRNLITVTIVTVFNRIYHEIRHDKYTTSTSPVYTKLSCS